MPSLFTVVAFFTAFRLLCPAICTRLWKGATSAAEFMFSRKLGSSATVVKTWSRYSTRRFFRMESFEMLTTIHVFGNIYSFFKLCFSSFEFHYVVTNVLACSVGGSHETLFCIIPL